MTLDEYNDAVLSAIINKTPCPSWADVDLTASDHPQSLQAFLRDHPDIAACAATCLGPTIPANAITQGAFSGSAINRDADPPKTMLDVSKEDADKHIEALKGIMRIVPSLQFSIANDPLSWDAITFWDNLDGMDIGEDDEEEQAAAERERILALLPTFRDDNTSQRRDTELRRTARNALLDELSAWLDAGALPYQPKD